MGQGSLEGRAYQFLIREQFAMLIALHYDRYGRN